MARLAQLCIALLHVLCLVFNGNAQLVACNQSDREALTDIKLGIEDSQNRISSWKGINCCQWWGIVCDNITGNVVSVDLHNRHPAGRVSAGRYALWNLSGEIRPSLTNLKSLRFLDLSFNTFRGKIPNFLSSLENLEYLNLSNAGFSGLIPPNLGNLSRLQFLDVSTDLNYALQLTVNNFEWMSSLLSLRYLAMSGSDLSNVGLGWMEALNKLPNLTQLHLSLCRLSSFTSELAFVNLTSLGVLDLSYNSFNSPLPSWLVNVSSLVHVDISGASLYGNFPVGFSEMPNLQSLKLGNNINLSASCSHLFSGSWEKLEILTFNYNNLHGKLPSSLGNLSSIRHLDLSQNGVKGGIPSSIGKLCNLQYID